MCDLKRKYPKIAIIYLLYYHNKSYIDSLVNALKNIDYPLDKMELVIVSNPHPKDGSFIYYLEEAVLPLVDKGEIPHTTIIANEENIGFAGGNNKGVQWAVDNNFDYVFFHNNDGFLDRNAFKELIAVMEEDNEIGIAQSLVLLYPETDLINTAGNKFHYLGFGYCDEYRQPLSKVKLPKVKEINYASGAALMVRVGLVKKYGAWDADFFLYHEDLEWSLRLRTLGYKIVMVRDSIFYHQYQFSRSISKFYYMERNRHAVMLMYFKIPTLILLAIIALPLEIGLWYFSLLNGYAEKRLEVYKYWLNPKNWRIWLVKRKIIQKQRRVSDRFLLKYTTSGIYFQDSKVENPALKYIGNPIMKFYYYFIIKALVWW